MVKSTASLADRPKKGTRAPMIAVCTARKKPSPQALKQTTSITTQTLIDENKDEDRINNKGECRLL
jgi:hypothetical protein